MKTLIAASAIVLTSVTGAFAASTALDIQETVKNPSAVILVGTSSADNELTDRARLGDGSPMYEAASASIDYAPTASIGVNEDEMRARLGDGSPRY
jgi:hypothetical protein